jgi:hypothetical protein
MLYTGHGLHYNSDFYTIFSYATMAILETNPEYLGKLEPYLWIWHTDKHGTSSQISYIL